MTQTPLDAVWEDVVRCMNLADYLFAWTGEGRPRVAVQLEMTPGFGHAGVTAVRGPITNDPWPYRVSSCAYAGYTQGHWTRDGRQLFCPGCGLDGT